MNKNFDYVKINRYVYNSMTEDEKVEFENARKNDPALENEVQFYDFLDKSLERIEEKERFKNLLKRIEAEDKVYRKKKRKLYSLYQKTSMAASVVFMLIFAFTFQHYRSIQKKNNAILTLQPKKQITDELSAPASQGLFSKQKYYTNETIPLNYSAYKTKISEISIRKKNSDFKVSITPYDVKSLSPDSLAEAGLYEVFILHYNGPNEERFYLLKPTEGIETSILIFGLCGAIGLFAFLFFIYKRRRIYDSKRVSESG